MGLERRGRVKRSHRHQPDCLCVFAEAIGVPVPGAVALVAGGAAAGTLSGPAVALFAVAATLSADSLLYIFGTNMGWTILKFLCRVSVDPETCVPRRGIVL
jgi:membrane protein DedA with SNARE-associated domain